MTLAEEVEPRRSNQHRNAVLELLSAIINENESKSKDDHRAIFKRMIVGEGFEDYLDGALGMVFTLKYAEALAAVRPKSSADLRQQAARRQATLAKEDALVETAKGIIAARLLDLKMANGKFLRECTGRECKRLGGFFAKIGERVGPTAIVGDVLKEEDLQKLLQAVSRARRR